MIETYTHEKHFHLVDGWLGARGMVVPPRELFSSHGYCVDECAIGFLFLGGNSKVAHIDNIVASPFVSAEKRDVALRTLFETLEQDAKNAGYLIVQTLTWIPTVKRRLKSLGYEYHAEYSLFYKEPQCLG